MAIEEALDGARGLLPWLALRSVGLTPHTSRWSRCCLRPADVSADEHVQDLADRELSPYGPPEWEVSLDLVPVAAAVGVPVLDDVTGGGQVGHDGVRAALGNPQDSGDFAQPHAAVVGNAEQGRA
jgi:hypothetical protein